MAHRRGSPLDRSPTEVLGGVLSLSHGCRSARFLHSVRSRALGYLLIVVAASTVLHERTSLWTW
ncbi:hypothetical protein ACWCPH_29705, partial [Streptomyces zhihengii]